MVIETGAGAGAAFPDAAYVAVGATIAPDAAAALGVGDIVLKVQRPLRAGEGAVDELALLKRGAVLIGMLQPLQHRDDVEAYAKAGVAAFAMELVPRITRAQSMDVLSSQANLAGYKAVLDAAGEFGHAFPMMMTAAGTIPPARVLVMGAGVAGLQAIATARRLGAVVSATDVRFAAKEQVESLGATFLAVDLEAMKAMETAGGYAKEMGEDFARRQREHVTEALKKIDIVLCTALIPGRKAPVLITRDMVAVMRPGSVIVDLAVEQGGNVEGSVVRQDGDDRQRRQHHRPCQHALAHRRRRQPALRPQPARLPGADHRQGQGPQDRHRRRDRQSHPADPRRRGGPSAIGPGGGRSIEPMEHSDVFVSFLTVFVLACFVGYYVVWRVTPALHSPLMSVTNAISSVIIVGALIAAGPAGLSFSKVMGFVAVILASINIFGGFIVTQRMLQMFQKKKPK